MPKEKSTTAPRKSTPSRRATGRKRSPSRTTDARSVRTTRASSRASSRASRRSSSSPSPPPLPSAIRGPALDNEALAKAWIDNEKPTDSVFATPSLVRRAEEAVGCAIQPFDHCQVAFFPTIGRKFGLERWLPTGLPKKGSRGPTCTNNGATNKICHKGAIPAFMYTHPEAACARAQARGYPVLVCRWDITPMGMLVPQACWSCCTHGESFCGLYALELSRVDITDSGLSPAPTHMAESVPNEATIATKSHSRTADAADLDPPPVPAKRSYPKPRLPTDPVDIFASHSGHAIGPHHVTARSASAELSLPNSKAPLSAPIPLALSTQLNQLASHRAQSEGVNVLPNLQTTSHLPDQTMLKERSAAGTSSLRQWETYLTTFMPASMYKAPVDTTPPHGSEVPRSLPDNRPHFPPSTLITPVLSPHRPNAESHPDPSTPASKTDPKGPSSVNEQLARLRANIDSCRSSTVFAAEAYVDSCQKLQLEANRVMDEAFECFQRMCEEAERDRQSLLSERREHEKNIVTLRDYDSVLVASTTQVSEQKVMIEKLEGQVSFLEQHLVQSRRGQGAVEKRMAQAYTEKAEAESERDAALRERDEMRDTARRALAQMEEAISVRKQAEAAITDAQVNISELRLTVRQQKKTIDTLQQQLSVPIGDRKEMPSVVNLHQSGTEDLDHGRAPVGTEATVFPPQYEVVPQYESTMNSSTDNMNGAADNTPPPKPMEEDAKEVDRAEEEIVNQLSVEQLNELLQGAGDVTSPKAPAIQVIPPTIVRALSPAEIAERMSHRSPSSRTTPTTVPLEENSPATYTGSLPGAFE